MNKLLNCRRSMVSLYAITCLTIICLYGLTHGLPDVGGVALGIAGICASLSGANAYEGAKNGITDGRPAQPAYPTRPIQPQAQPTYPGVEVQVTHIKPDSPD